MVWAFLNNPWVIGIGGGLISGALVYFTTIHIISRRDDKVYAQKISQANSELLHILRPHIITGKKFDVELYDSVVSSLSNKYEIDTKDIYGLDEALNEIITDIMQTSFLTGKQKNVFSKKLISIKSQTKKKEKLIYLRPSFNTISSKMFSLTLATMTMAMAIIAVIFGGFQKTIVPAFDIAQIQTILLVLITAIPIILTIIFMLTGIKKRLRRIFNEEE